MPELRWHVSLLGLPPRVVAFEIRARRLARRSSDQFSLSSATRPPDLRALLALARGRRHVVELGTATAWTAISLALAERERQVLSLDVFARPEPLRYLALVDQSVRSRITLETRPGADGPRSLEPVDLLYIDSSHERHATIAEVLAWRPVMAAGAAIVFDDYSHPDFPGVREAVAELGLTGEPRGTMFVHRVPGPRPAV